MNTLDLKGIKHLNINFKLDFLGFSVSNMISHNYKIEPVGDKVKSSGLRIKEQKKWVILPRGSQFIWGNRHVKTSYFAYHTTSTTVEFQGQPEANASEETEESLYMT